jgi:hypothetical protein
MGEIAIWHHKLVKKYQGNGFKAVIWQNLFYRLKHRKEATTINNLVGKNRSVDGDTTAVFQTCQERLFTRIPTLQPKQVVIVIAFL